MYGGSGQALPCKLLGACCASVRNTSPLVLSDGLLIDGKHGGNNMSIEKRGVLAHWWTCLAWHCLINGSDTSHHSPLAESIMIFTPAMGGSRPSQEHVMPDRVQECK